MKNQYVGDINDYRKYGLLRAIQSVGAFRLAVAWMLTPDDASNDGNLTAYLDQPDKWSRFDPGLFAALRASLVSNRERGVGLIEEAGLVDNTTFFSETVPDDRGGRAHWFNNLLLAVDSSDLVFLDPDNGLEIQSKPLGAKNSSKFLFYQEVASLWAEGKSLLVYQHFPMIKRSAYIGQRLDELHGHVENAGIEAFFTPHVAFFLLLQPDHAHHQAAIREVVLHRWPHQFGVFDAIATPKTNALTPRLASKEKAPTPSSGPFRSGSTKTTTIGYVNRNQQENLGHRGTPGTDHGQVAYKLRCLKCSQAYGANGTDLFQRKCPKCQGGNPGIPY